MTKNKLSPDDPRLTTYALGEMEAEELRAFEALLAEDAEASAEVEAIRAFAGNIEKELSTEATAEVQSSKVFEYPTEKKRRAVSRIYVWGSLAAAAGLTLLIGFDQYVEFEKRTLRDAEYKEMRMEALEKAKAGAHQRKKERGTVGQVGTLTAAAPGSPHQNNADEAKAEVPMQAVLASADKAGFERASSSPMVQERVRGIDTRNEGYSLLVESGYSAVQASPLSTFSIDVDTASYANVRRFLTAGQLPPAEAVRVEELVNYFSYHYSPPSGNGEAPVNAALEVASCPWNPAHRLVRIGLKAKEIAAQDRPASNLVLLLDTSGSMDEPNKLPLVKQAVRLLADSLRPQDHLSIVTYAGSSGLALPATDGTHKREIYDAIEALNPGGSTYGSMGIQLAYDIAKANFVPGGVNRVVLCTDGDFNVGVTSQTDLQKLIETKAKSGVFLSVLGFGMGNLKDSTLEMLADKGNGNYGYVDTLQEAKRLFVEQAGGTLVTVAKDVKVQVEFNPGKVSSYRLVGYENRRLAAEEFNDDKIDAGEMGAGHTVTALYEIVPAGGSEVVPGVDPLRYRGPSFVKGTVAPDELLMVKVRYKPVDGDESRKLEFPLKDTGASFEAASGDFKFASATAAFGQLLRGSKFAGTATFAKVQVWIEESGQQQQDAYRAEFLNLVKRASVIDSEAR